MDFQVLHMHLLFSDSSHAGAHGEWSERVGPGGPVHIQSHTPVATKKQLEPGVVFCGPLLGPLHLSPKASVTITRRVTMTRVVGLLAAHRHCSSFHDAHNMCQGLHCIPPWFRDILWMVLQASNQSKSPNGFRV